MVNFKMKVKIIGLKYFFNILTGSSYHPRSTFGPLIALRFYTFFCATKIIIEENTKDFMDNLIRNVNKLTLRIF